MRKPLVCANWKMNKTLPESVDYMIKLIESESDYKDLDIIICPSIVSLAFLSEVLGEASNISLGVQNIYQGEEGSFTGEVSIKQIEDYSKYVIVGHSERRNVFKETDEMITEKMGYLTQNSKVTPILCIGETMEVRQNGNIKEYLQNELEKALEFVPKKFLNNMVVAYEPYWAISDGKNMKVMPAAQDIEQNAKFIREILESRYDSNVSEETRILYGGSVSRDNVKGIIKCENVDGVLIGATSLDVSHFKDILGVVNSFYS